jgi:hypothetical protein
MADEMRLHANADFSVVSLFLFCHASARTKAELDVAEPTSNLIFWIASVLSSIAGSLVIVLSVRTIFMIA